MKIRGFNIQNREKFRKFYKELTDEKYPPLLICCNHLTYIDSAILIYAFGSHLWYTLFFRRHMWNLVAKEYAKNPVFRFVCYLSKCIFINREKEREDLFPTLNTAEALLRSGEIVLIFPEGRRSKTGKFDDSRLAYGVGRVAASLGECRLLCVYLRAPEQGMRSSSFPPPNSNFTILKELVTYKSESSTKASALKITKDVAERIKKLEEQYFQLQQ